MHRLDALVVAEISYQLEQSNVIVNFIGVIDGWGKHGNVDFDTDYVRRIIHHHHPNAQQNADFDKQTLWESLLHHRLNMMLRYPYKSLQSPMVLFKAQDLLPEYREMDAPDNHWAQYVSDFLIVTVPGDHNSMMLEPHIARLIEEMNPSLKEKQRKQSPCNANICSQNTQILKKKN